MAKGKTTTAKAVTAKLEQKNALRSTNGNSYVTEDFTPSTGIPIKLKGISQLMLDSINSSVEAPKVPQYSVPIGEGDDQLEWHDLDQTVIDDPSLTPEEKEKFTETWNAYKEDLVRYNHKIRDSVVRVIMMRGVIVDLPEDDMWIQEEIFIGINVPPKDKPIELKYHYIMNEVIGTPEDLTYITDTVMRLTRIPEEVLQEAEAMFRAAQEAGQE